MQYCDLFEIFDREVRRSFERKVFQKGLDAETLLGMPVKLNPEGYRGCSLSESTAGSQRLALVPLSGRRLVVVAHTKE